MDIQDARNVVESILKNEKPEGYSIDWVQGIENRDTIGKKIAAFATSDGGWLIIGIDDNRRASDIGDKQSLITAVGEVLRNCQPIPSLNDPQFIEIENKSVAVYKIPSLGGAICEYNGTPYHRVQDSAKKMTTQEVMRKLSAYGVVCWERMPSTAGVEQIDGEELEFYLQKANARNPVDQKTADAFLISNKALSEDRKHLTNLGTIVLSKKPSDFIPQCKIQMVRFKGTKPVDRVAAFLAEYPARKMIMSCMNFVKLNLPVRERHEGANRIEEPVIPERALREAVVNMVVHRDYNDSQESLIRIFDDRIEFQNPGAPDKLEMEKILHQGIPLHRNQGIYNFLRPVHQAEAAGQGIPIMKKEMKRVGLGEPEITILSSIFHITMRFEERGPDTLEDTILFYGREKGSISTSDVMAIYKLSRPTAIRILNGLVAKGFAKHEGKRRNSKYIF
ncbi:MAG: hypothetical protein FJY76_03205 [Candidatus Aenigmarchaeota archaeon]|nr:hypothetical protein [Candidatus Aenigmarchaeota archaeon]